MILLIIFVVVASSAAIGAFLVLIWGNLLLGRDDARARSIRAAIDINRMVIEARNRMIDAALHGLREDRQS